MYDICALRFFNRNNFFLAAYLQITLIKFVFIHYPHYAYRYLFKIGTRMHKKKKKLFPIMSYFNNTSAINSQKCK